MTLEEQLAWNDDWQAWRRWRAAVESVGVFVFQFPSVPLEQTRGMSLLRDPLPVIGINSKETAAGARAFSLLHELAHVALAVGRDEATAQYEKRSAAEWMNVERFAEEAASVALVPDDALQDVLDDVGGDGQRWTLASVREVAAAFRITPLAMATRLRAAGILSWDAYRRWRSEWDAYVRTLPPRKGGFAAPAANALSRAGRPFVQLVLQALDANRITAVDASHYLELRFDHIEKLRLELRAGEDSRTRRLAA